MKTPTKEMEEQIVKRAKINGLLKLGVRKAEISRRLGVSRPTIDRWANRETIFDEKRSGRPTKITSSVEKKIETVMRDKVGVGTRTTARCLNAEFASSGSERTISRTTIIRHLRSTDWGSKVRYVKNKQPQPKTAKPKSNLKQPKRNIPSRKTKKNSS